MILDRITGLPEQTEQAPIARCLYRDGDLAFFDLRDPQPYFRPAIFTEVDWLTPAQMLDYRSRMTRSSYRTWQQEGVATIRTGRMAA